MLSYIMEQTIQNILSNVHVLCEAEPKVKTGLEKYGKEFLINFSRIHRLYNFVEGLNLNKSI